jgi:hypothetical protein
MPEAVAQAIEAPSVVTAAQPTFLVEIGDVADLRQRQAPLHRLSCGPTNLELAEIARKIAQPFVIEMLVMEYQHGVAVDRLPDCVDYRGIDEPTKLDAADFGSELRTNRPNLHRHLCNLPCSGALVSTRRSAGILLESINRSSAGPAAIREGEVLPLTRARPFIRG